MYSLIEIVNEVENNDVKSLPPSFFHFCTPFNNDTVTNIMSEIEFINENSLFFPISNGNNFSTKEFFLITFLSFFSPLFFEAIFAILFLSCRWRSGLGC